MAARIVPDKFCAVEDCSTNVTSRGYCSKHYQRFLRNGDPLLSKYDRENKNPTCSVEWCNAQRAAKGLCQKHYLRVKNHGSVRGFHPRYRKKIRWLERHAEHAGTECLIWPFGVNDRGRGTVTCDGRNMSAPKVMCILAHGEPPTAKHQAAHICGKGHEGCMNPRHLRWATASENERDKIKHGTIRRGSDVNTSKLSADEVREIRRLRGTMTGAAIAERFGVTPTMVSNIHNNKAWRWLT